MELRVAELAEAAGVGVDTVRFYQSRGLIPAPLRRGRFAIYSEQHLERLRRVRSLLDSGFSLAQIRQILESDLEKPSTRPMKRIIEPLIAMGAGIDAADGATAPLAISGGRKLVGIRYALPLASAPKSAYQRGRKLPIASLP